MRKLILPAAVIAVALLTSTVVGAQTAQFNRWNGLTSSAFTQGRVQVNAPYQPPCDEDDFAVMGDINVHCVNYDSDTCLGYSTHVNAAFDSVLDVWRLNGLAGYLPPPGGDTEEAALLGLIGRRMTVSTFAVEGYFYVFATPPIGAAEVAVIRYSGDPTAFDGVAAGSVHDLVDLGLIAPGDILYEVGFDAYAEFQFEVDVTGLDDDEIVIFGTVAGPIPPCQDVPATTGVAAMLLLLILLGSSAYYLWGGRRPNRDQCVPPGRAP